MEKADIKAVTFNENASQNDISKALRPEKGAHLIFASPGYLLRNSRMKKLYVEEEGRARVLGVLVDGAHVIHEWANNFRRDYRELKALRVILGNNVPWWALSATFTNQIFKTVYETLIPEGTQTEDDIPTTVIFLRLISETRGACLTIQALPPPHLHPCIQ